MYEYEVRGRGNFPWDMLRYDRVYPLTSPVPNYRDGEDIWRGVRTILMRGEGCTPARWASFGWTVLDEENVLIRGILRANKENKIS